MTLVAEVGVPVSEETPRRRRGKGLPVDELRDRYPSLKHLADEPNRAGERSWVAVFNLRPDAMHAMFADLIKQVHATPGRIGQRPMPKEEEVDFQSLVYGEQNELPLTEALPKMVKTSERAFCSKVAMSRTQYQRMLSGKYQPDAKELRLIAAAIKKPATFFVEYRKIMAISAFVNMIEQRPGIATMLYRDYLTVKIDDQ